MAVPHITDMKPRHGSDGQVVEIVGTGFGDPFTSSPPVCTIEAGNVTTITVTAFTDTEIRATMPANPHGGATYDLRVTTAGGYDILKTAWYYG